MTSGPIGGFRQGRGFTDAEQVLANDIRADNDRAGRRLDQARKPACEHRLSRPRQSADRHQQRRLGRDEASRQIEIALGLPPDRVVPSGLLALHEQHMRPDRGPHRQKQRQQAEAIETFIPCPRQVAIEHLVRRRGLIEMNQIHQREGEIVEHIRRRDDGIEFDGIEQQRPAVHQRNIGEMQIAMTTAHEPAAGTLLRAAAAVSSQHRGWRHRADRRQRHQVRARCGILRCCVR